MIKNHKGLTQIANSELENFRLTVTEEAPFRSNFL